MMRAPALLLSAMLSLAAACVPAEPEAGAPARPSAAGSPDWTGYRAAGNEPFWTMTFGESTMDFSDLGDTSVGSAVRPEPERLADGWRFAATAGGRPFVVEIRERRCNDSMSGTPFPHTVRVTVHGRSYAGCGGDATSLLTGEEWSVTRLEGEETVERRRPTLSFAADGALTGDGGCNRFRASYEVTGEGIAIGPALATRRACVEPELNRQELRFFAVLERVTRFDVAGDGALELFAGDRRVLVARRRPD